MSNFLTQNALKGTLHPTATVSDYDLLFDLGVRGMQRMAGYVPAITRLSIPDAAAVDEKHLCSEHTVRQFYWIMRKNYRGLRFSWLQKFSETGQCLPNELIPIVMDNHFGVFRIPKFEGIGNHRAKWLADISQNQQWLWFHSESQQSQRSPHNFRRSLSRIGEYKQARKEGNSEKAQDWLYTNWKRLASKERLAVLDTMCETLRFDDLPFLLEQLNMLDEVKDSNLFDKVCYMVSILHPERFEGLIRDILGLIELDFVGRQTMPVLDFAWSNAFRQTAHYSGRGILRKLAAKYRWWETLDQLVRLVPLSDWLEQWKCDADVLLNGAYHGLNSDIFIPLWLQRAIDEGHEAFALGILKHQKPITYFFGWRISKQNQLLECLSFDSMQILLDEVWMNPHREVTWQIR